MLLHYISDEKGHKNSERGLTVNERYHFVVRSCCNNGFKSKVMSEWRGNKT